jgi:phosphohistidine swiveling domain-containing protein
MKWTKIMAHRQTNFLFTYPVLAGLSHNFREGLFVWDRDGYTDFIMSTAEIWEESRTLSQRIKTEPQYVDDYRKYSIDVCEGTVRIARQIRDTELVTADDRKLQHQAKQLFEMLEKVGTTIIQTRFDAYEQIKTYARDNHLSPGQLRTLIAPPDLSLLTRSQMKLLKLICDYDDRKLTDDQFEEALDLHAEEYSWVTTDVGFGIPLTKGDLKRQVKQSQRGDNFHEEYEQLTNYANRIAEEKNELLDRLDPPPDVRRLMIALADESFFRQYRRDTYSQAEYYARPLFEEMARRADLALKEIYYLTPDEVSAFLIGNCLPDPSLIQSRIQVGVIFRIHDGQTTLVSGKEVDEIVSLELSDDEQQDFSSWQFVEGEIAFSGKARGIARVVKSEKDLAQVEHGDIFIASQATPNLINRIIDKVTAIVTDEGDITSHAALVAWEHQVPCVVGTLNATKVFRSGEAVEVDAEKSLAERCIVRKI